MFLVGVIIAIVIIVILSITVTVICHFMTMSINIMILLLPMITTIIDHRPLLDEGMHSNHDLGLVHGCHGHTGMAPKACNVNVDVDGNTPRCCP